jgi:hypothetical protein
MQHRAALAVVIAIARASAAATLLVTVPCCGGLAAPLVVGALAAPSLGNCVARDIAAERRALATRCPATPMPARPKMPSDDSARALQHAANGGVARVEQITARCAVECRRVITHHSGHHQHHAQHDDETQSHDVAAAAAADDSSNSGGDGAAGTGRTAREAAGCVASDGDSARRRLCDGQFEWRRCATARRARRRRVRAATIRRRRPARIVKKKKKKVRAQPSAVARVLDECLLTLYRSFVWTPLALDRETKFDTAVEYRARVRGFGSAPEVMLVAQGVEADTLYFAFRGKQGVIDCSALHTLRVTAGAASATSTSALVEPRHAVVSLEARAASLSADEAKKQATQTAMRIESLLQSVGAVPSPAPSPAPARIRRRQVVSMSSHPN